MIIGIIGVIIGILLIVAGVYYFVKEKNDVESRKIYLITMIIGVVVAYKKRNQKKYNPLKGIRYFIYHHLVRLKLVRFLNSKLF